MVLKHTKTNNKRELPRVFYLKFHNNEEAFGITDKVEISSLGLGSSPLLQEIINQEQGEIYG